VIPERLKTVLAAELSEEDRAAFDAFVAGSPYSAYQQSRAWAEHAPRARRQDFLYFLCRDGGALVGVGVVRRSRLGPLARLGTLQRGPVVQDVERLGAVVAALKYALRQAGFSTLVLGPRIGGDECAPALRILKGEGLKPLPQDRQSLHTATGKIDLGRGEEAVLAGFKQRGRRQIRAAAKQGVTVRPAASAEDLAAYQAVLSDFQRRKSRYETAGLPDVLQQAAIVRANGGAILIAEREGAVIGGHAFVVQGADATWLSMATSDLDPAIPRSYALLWEAIRLARTMGCRSYDLAGMSEGESGDGGEASRDQFKGAFAPRLDRLVPAHVAPLRPLRHFVFFNGRQIYRSARRSIRSFRSPAA
jgi:hypothetical protein